MVTIQQSSAPQITNHLQFHPPKFFVYHGHSQSQSLLMRAQTRFLQAQFWSKPFRLIKSSWRLQTLQFWRPSTYVYPETDGQTKRTIPLSTYFLHAPFAHFLSIQVHTNWDIQITSYQSHCRVCIQQLTCLN